MKSVLSLSFVVLILSIISNSSHAEIYMHEGYENINSPVAEYMENNYLLHPSYAGHAEKNMHVSDRAFVGNKSLLLISDPNIEDPTERHRTEFSHYINDGNGFGPGDHKCYAFSVMVGDEKFPSNYSGFNIFQIKIDGNANAWPNFTIEPIPHEGKVHIYINPSDLNDQPIIREYAKPGITANMWERWVVEYKPSMSGDGKAVVWRNGKIVYEHHGATQVNNNRLYFKHGRYNFPYRSNYQLDAIRKEGIGKTYTYFDDYIMADGGNCVNELKEAAPHYFDSSFNGQMDNRPNPEVSRLDLSYKRILVRAKATHENTSLVFNVKGEDRSTLSYGPDAQSLWYHVYSMPGEESLGIHDISLKFNSDGQEGKGVYVYHVQADNAYYFGSDADTQNSAYLYQNSCGGAGNYPGNSWMNCTGVMRFACDTNKEACPDEKAAEPKSEPTPEEPSVEEPTAEPPVVEELPVVEKPIEEELPVVEEPASEEAPTTEEGTSGSLENDPTEFFKPDVGENPKLSNIAYGKGVRISSQEPGFPDPSVATDGVKTITSLDDELSKIAHSKYEYKPYIDIDLEDIFEIDAIVIMNRVGEKERMRDFDVKLYDNCNDLQLVDSIYASSYPNTSETYRFADKPKASCVRIQLRGTNYLHLREVEVYGKLVQAVSNVSPFFKPDVGVNPKKSNVAFGKGVRISSQEPNFSNPSVLTDGVKTITSLEDEKSKIAHSTYEFKPYVDIDLEDTYEVSAVVVINRVSDKERMRDFDVKLYNNCKDLQLVGSAYDSNYPNTSETYRFADKPKASCVRIQLRGTNYLHLREVEVYGRLVE